MYIYCNSPKEAILVFKKKYSWGRSRGNDEQQYRPRALPDCC